MKVYILRRGTMSCICTAIIALVFAAPANAGVLWANGDYDGDDGLNNAAGLAYYPGLTTFSAYTATVYQEFVVPTAQTWTITSVYSVDQTIFLNSLGATINPSTASYKILEGVSAGNGGTTLASGTVTANVTAMAQTPGYYYAGTPMEISTTLTSSLVLTAGTYWLAVTPTDPNGYVEDQSWVETTSGANSIGFSAGNLAYFSDTAPAAEGGGESFQSAAAALAGDAYSTPQFDMGVVGTSVTAVPEPSTLLLSIVAGCVAACWFAGRKLIARVDAARLQSA